MITTIFFDLDDTLLDFHQAESNALCETLHRLSLPSSPAIIAHYSQINRAQWERLERGVLTREQVLVERFVLFFASLGITADPVLAQTYYEALLAEEHALLPGAIALLEQLLGKYCLCAASNGTPFIQNRRLSASGLRRYFDHIFISGEIGADKPLPAFFDACFAALPGVSRAETVIVGDSLTSDIRGGTMAGLHTVWFHPAGMGGDRACADARIDAEITSLAALPDILKAM